MNFKVLLTLLVLALTAFAVNAEREREIDDYTAEPTYYTGDKKK
uniref:Putative secreted small salivary protein n=1 Tax=Xenopsylla cheopis TaxID=163159 RepID=A2IAB6_XENCH|nr:putative secreted small salivary protein [Xenopsylla cheopis]